MTPQMRNVLSFIETYFADRKVAPTYEEIRAHLGIASKSGAHRIVSSLIERGYLKRPAGDHSARNLLPATIDLRDFPTESLIAELSRRSAANV